MQTCSLSLNSFEKVKFCLRDRFGGNYNAFQRVSQILYVSFNHNDKFQIYATNYRRTQSEESFPKAELYKILAKRAQQVPK